MKKNLLRFFNYSTKNNFSIFDVIVILFLSQYVSNSIFYVVLALTYFFISPFIYGLIRKALEK